MSKNKLFVRLIAVFIVSAFVVSACSSEEAERIRYEHTREYCDKYPYRHVPITQLQECYQTVAKRKANDCRISDLTAIQVRRETILESLPDWVPDYTAAQKRQFDLATSLIGDIGAWQDKCDALFVPELKDRKVWWSDD